ncbi:hypothetical protein N2152v2_002467 [Parachlorella kessleri]
MGSASETVHLLLSDIASIDGHSLWFSLFWGLLALCILQVANSSYTRRRLVKQRQLLARLTAENAELKLKQRVRDQEHSEVVKRLKHEQTVVLKKVQQLESVLEKL